MSFNRLYNTKNPNQGPQKRVLCLCSAGLLRSPTVAWVLSNAPYDYNTRAAGVTKEYALIYADQYLVEWADEIVCVTPEVEEEFRHNCGRDEIDISGDFTPIITLNILDVYKRRAPKLVKLIQDQYDKTESDRRVPPDACNPAT